MYVYVYVYVYVWGGQVSVMSLFERRAIGIPMFAPSLDLLCQWHMRYGLVFERRFPCMLLVCSSSQRRACSHSMYVVRVRQAVGKGCQSLKPQACCQAVTWCVARCQGVLQPQAWCVSTASLLLPSHGLVC